MFQLQTSPPQLFTGQSVSLKQGAGSTVGVGNGIVIVAVPAVDVAVPAVDVAVPPVDVAVPAVEVELPPTAWVPA